MSFSNNIESNFNDEIKNENIIKNFSSYLIKNSKQKALVECFQNSSLNGRPASTVLLSQEHNICCITSLGLSLLNSSTEISLDFPIEYFSEAHEVFNDLIQDIMKGDYKKSQPSEKYIIGERLGLIYEKIKIEPEEYPKIWVRLKNFSKNRNFKGTLIRFVGKYKKINFCVGCRKIFTSLPSICCNCNNFRYCSDECRDNNSTEHQFICNMIQKSFVTLHNYVTKEEIDYNINKWLETLIVPPYPESSQYD